MGAVASLIENALARAVPVLIGFLASLLGVSGLASKVTKIFQKIQQRVEKAVTKLWVKIKEMGKKVLAKLGIGGKDEHDPEKQQKIDAGFIYLKQQERQLDSDGNNKLTLEQANQAAQRTKAAHPVFSSLSAVPKGDKVSYKYTASPESERETGTELEGGNSIGFEIGQLIKARYIDGMWIAKIKTIDNNNQEVVIEFIDTRKGKKDYSFDKFIAERESGDIEEYNPQSNRDYYMGSNPSRNSDFGVRLKARWKTSSNPVDGSYNNPSVSVEQIWWKGSWIPIQATDLGHHPESAVDWWNRKGYEYGPRAPEVRDWMTDPINYRFEESGYNQLRGSLDSASGKRYRLPYKDDE